MITIRRDAWNNSTVTLALPHTDTDSRPDPVSVTVVHLLRHGKVHNPGNILYGRLPGYRLAASGRAMADGVADFLSGADISYLAASSLQRAQETAAPLAAAHGLRIVTDDRIIEAANHFEGSAFGLNRQVLGRPQSWTKLRDPRLPSWGEPYLQIAHRMLAAIYTAVHAADGHQAVLVSHQLPIVTARRYLEGKRLWHDPRHRTCSVASLTSLSFTDGVFTGASYAQPVGHIAAVNDPDVEMVALPVVTAPEAAAVRSVMESSDPPTVAAVPPTVAAVPPAVAGVPSTVAGLPPVEGAAR